MSIEDFIKENTAALNRLTSALTALSVLPAAAAGAPAPIAGSVNPAAEKKPAATEPSGEAPKLSYDENVRKPFLALLNAKRDAAMKLLADLGVSNLKGFEGKPETFADLAQKIKEAQNG